MKVIDRYIGWKLQSREEEEEERKRRMDVEIKLGAHVTWDTLG